MLKLTSTELSRINTETLIIPVCPDRDIHRSPTIRSLTRQVLGLQDVSGRKGRRTIPAPAP